MRPLPAFGLLGLLALTSPRASAQNPPGYDDALARYQECSQRVPFRHHLEGRQRLAETRAVAALTLLANDYARPRLFPEESRYTLAHLIGKNFDRTEFVEPLAALRTAHQQPVDTWLWVNTLRIHTDRVGDSEAVTLAQEGKNALQRAAAIAAVGASRSANLKAVVVPTCVNFPPKTKEADRMVLLGAMSGALWDNRSRVNDAAYREALTAYIDLLGDDVGLSHTAKVQMARHLQWILKGPALFVNKEPWLELMQRGDVKRPGPAHTVVAPRFFGVETEGERICYVVDMSDSMCKEITPESKPATGPTTGPKVKKKRELMDESDLPWHKINTRWDLAREQLRISLFRLTPDKHFSIVWFGTESGTLDSCKGMIKATRPNVDRVIAELDSIQAIPKGRLDAEQAEIAPDGKLRGRTNVHSGLRRAYGLAGRGFVESCAYVDPEALTEGCDTIFLLSDGAPSWDDFAAEDKDYGEDNVIVDIEYKKPAPRQPRINYHGPYVHDQWLVADVQRMNAFRRIRLHCIGLGEANMELLRRLAEMGHGEVYAVGNKKREELTGGKEDPKKK
ncbi:MAG: hypothetical protein WBO45_01375 [Planctomycetota bacterium]